MKKEIGKRISEARKEKGLTLKKLGEKTGGLNPTRISNWENGLRTPGPLEIKQLAGALDISPAFLMGFTEEKGDDTDITPGMPYDNSVPKAYRATPEPIPITIPWKFINFFNTLPQEKINRIFEVIEEKIKNLK